MSNILFETIATNNNFVTLVECIKEIEDPRVNRNLYHPFVPIVVISLCAVIGGANNWVAVAEFGQNHHDWFIKFLHLPYGIPSHDTFTDVFSAINHKELQDWLFLWLEEVLGSQGNQVAIDGKIIKSWKSKDPLTILRACAGQCQVVIGQATVRRGSNEITELPNILRQLFLKGKVVTIDAIGTQKNIVEQIIKQEADYVLPAKRNQPWLHSNIKLFLDDIIDNKFNDVSHAYFETENYGHGRHEIRKCWATEDIAWFDEKHLWKNLRSICVIESIRSEKGKVSVTRRYFISSLSADAQRLLMIIRNHWMIENGPHWAMDLVFEEDRSTIRRGFGPQNFALLRSFGYSLLKYNSAKGGLKIKRNRANCNFNEMAKILLPSTC